MKRWEWVSMLLLAALIIICTVIGISDSIAQQKEWNRQQAIAHVADERPVYYGGGR